MKSLIDHWGGYRDVVYVWNGLVVIRHQQIKHSLQIVSLQIPVDVA